MKFQIICNQQGRLRLRFGKYIFNQKQGYGLEAMLLSCKGVETVVANYQNGGLLITYHSDTVSADDIISIVETYRITELPELPPNEEQKKREMDAHYKKKFAKLVAMHFVIRPATSLLLPVTLRKVRVWCRASRFIHHGVASLHRHRRLTVETLDATAITASLCCGNHKTSSSIMFMLNLSDLLMEYSNARAKSALAGSLAINISQVWLVKDEEEISIPMKELAVGDVIHVQLGSMIPVDGTIVKGDALINEATMTGEPLAVHKSAGNTVFAGTVIEEGDLYIEVRTLCSDSRIAKIIEMIDTEEELKASIQSNAERLADGIVPISFGAFFGTLLLTGNMARALSVLMVDFSCAIKLTTPLVILTALREAGIKEIIMITGDNESTARYIAEEIGLDHYFAGILPDGKANLVQQLKDEGRKILMVGDGINDAPALSCANVSMTLNGSSDIAREVSDIAIHSDSLEEIVHARKLATALMSRINNNYHFIVGFNTSLIGLGITGVITNNTAAWLHNASTFGLAALSTRPMISNTDKGGALDETA